MLTICTALVEDERQRANLCECVEILGGKPIVTDDTVSVEIDAPQETADKFAELFVQYSVHGISTIQRR